ncbi:hypothetical protein PLICRDRAFT_44907 [Plicaturopsis crispa FD-325 SS-3]|nr:hypothetical protein PLICRDRAFT_44907 [Plicaturopsis crispa FD-325 SS-3]
MKYSSTGKKLLAAFVGLFLANLITLAFAARVNEFQEYYFVADLFPLALSIFTMVVLFFMTISGFTAKESSLVKAPFMIIVLSLLTVLWLAFNAFSTSRWRHVPLMCSAIPSEYADMKSWCLDLQVLKSFVWIEWVILLLTTASIARFAFSEHSAGHKHVWTTPFSRYTPYAGGSMYNDSYGVGPEMYPTSDAASDFLQFEKPYRS